MLLLAFDLSTPYGSAAVGDEGGVLARRDLVAERQQAVELVPAIDALLKEVRVSPRDLEGVVVGRGPGSFTGVRIAAATARGMAAGLEVPLWSLSSLVAGAVSCGASVGERPRYILFDARGDRVYAACYRILDGRGEGSPRGAVEVEILLGPSATTVQEVLSSEIPSGTIFAGDGALRHEMAFRAAGYEVLPPPLGMPSAEGLLHLAFTPGVHPEEEGSRWEPDYLRGSSAIPLAER